MRRVISKLIARATETLLPTNMVSRLRSGREWKVWVDSLTPDLLDDLTNEPMEKKRRIFRTHVRLIEIETHAKCNRVCQFCPNVIVNRQRNNTLADSKMLNRIFEELGSIDYSGQIKVARYSEPLSYRQHLYERIATARALVPHAQLAIVTNTDYLTPAVMSQLLEAGLDVVYMSIYLKENKRWTTELAHAYSERLAKKLGVSALTTRETPVSLHQTYKYKGLDLRSTCVNFDKYGTDRGGVMQQYTGLERVGPCWEPFETFVVDYNGSVMPCCNFRSDLPEHRNFVIGDLSVPGTSIFDLYAGRLSAWRQSMVSFGTKASLCKTCRHRDISEDLVVSVARRLKKQLHRIDCDRYY